MLPINDKKTNTCIQIKNSLKQENMVILVLIYQKEKVSKGYAKKNLYFLAVNKLFTFLKKRQT